MAVAERENVSNPDLGHDEDRFSQRKTEQWSQQERDSMRSTFDTSKDSRTQRPDMGGAPQEASAPAAVASPAARPGLASRAWSGMKSAAGAAWGGLKSGASWLGRKLLRGSA
jgi:hypothetical protein